MQALGRTKRLPYTDVIQGENEERGVIHDGKIPPGFFSPPPPNTPRSAHNHLVSSSQGEMTEPTMALEYRGTMQYDGSAS